MARAKPRHEGMDTIDLTIDSHGVGHAVRFTSRKLFRLAEKMDNGVRVRFVYTTKQGRYVVRGRITAGPEDQEEQGERLRCDPVTWAHSFQLRSDRTLDILDTLDQLHGRDLGLIDRIAVAQRVPVLRELDIQAPLQGLCPASLPDALGLEYGTGPTLIRKKHTNTHCPDP